MLNDWKIIVLYFHNVTYKKSERKRPSNYWPMFYLAGVDAPSVVNSCRVCHGAHLDTVCALDVLTAPNSTGTKTLFKHWP